MDTKGVEPWAYMIVGGVQLATHSWMSHRRMSSDELIDYLTMLSWSALCGIVETNGSLAAFNSQPHPTPVLPTAVDEAPDSRPRAYRLTVMADDLPSQWTHEPDRVLEFEPGEQGRRHRHRLQSGIPGDKADAPRIQAERNAVFADLQEKSTPTAARRRQALHPAGAAGHGHRGQGRHRQPRRRRRQPDGHRLPRLRGAHRGGTRKHHYLWRIRKALPAAGHIGVFDRSHYEDVPMVRVHNLVPPEVWNAALRRDQRVREGTRRRRDDDREGRDVRVTRRAEAYLAARPEDPTSTGSTTRAT